MQTSAFDIQLKENRMDQGPRAIGNSFVCFKRDDIFNREQSRVQIMSYARGYRQRIIIIIKKEKALYED